MKRSLASPGGGILLGILLVPAPLALVGSEAAAQVQPGWVEARGGPATAWSFSMAYDVARERVVLFGGADTSGRLLSETWEWDGNNWTQRSRTNSPSPRSNHAAAYDVARQRVVMFGGTNGSVPAFLDTWHYGSPATIQAFGTACSASSRSPILTGDAPYLGVSVGRQDQAIPPCTLYLQNPIIPLLAVTNWAGFARSQTFALPLKNSLRGLGFYAQAFVADPQGPVGGLTFSAGLKLVIGD
jgi:hypothetical protein